jgi:PAS domain S-box-containing protein
MPQTSLALFMQTQRQLYLARLPEKVAALDAALQQLGSTGDAAAALAALAQAHQLVGSGGTFGFPAVSQAAAAIEKILSGLAGVERPLGAPERSALGAGLQALKAAQLATGVTPPTASDLAGADTAFAPPRPTRLVFIVEPDQQAASQLAAQLGRSGYQSRIFDRPPLPAQERPAAILAQIAFSADPLLARQAVDGEWAGIPLIFMSGDSGFEVRLQAVRSGAIGYFPQPVDLQALVTLLDRVTSGEPARPYRVLIVEDDEALANFYAGVLQSAGIETAVVTDPSQVMGPLIDFEPDLITCDIYMPQCNGMELAALIRQQQAFVRIPIVFLSSETSLDKQAQALKQGGDDFITKPVAPAVLIAAAQSRARRYRSLLAAEDTLRISEERFRLVFETSLDGFIQGLADGTVISANQAACTMLRMDEQQIKAAGLAGLVAAGDPRLADLLGQTSRSGKFRGELSCVRGDGTHFPVEVSSSQHISSNGDTQVSVILRDITERKFAEQQILQLNAELETRVERRTAELTAANQELQTFSHSLAHDLRQPYIAINGLTSLLEREVAGCVSERGKHYLSRIHASVSQMNERTDSLLALAQLSRVQTRREQLDLGAMASKVLRKLQQQDPERTVHAHVQQPLPVQADAGLLLQLLNILLGNAWKFSSGQASADITVGAEVGPAGETVFFVKDSGAGFDMAYVANLFGAFQRLHDPSEFAGAGMGLATARRIVTRHGGRIWASSAPGEGACFCFTLAPP